MIAIELSQFTNLARKAKHQMSPEKASGRRKYTTNHPLRRFLFVAALLLLPICLCDDNLTNDEHGNQPPLDIFNAARDGDAEAIHAFVQIQRDEHDDVLITESLCKRDENGWTPMHIAAKHGHVAVLEALLDAGADANPKLLSNGTTPLQWAACMGKTDAVKMLISRGADVNHRDLNLRWIALHWAAAVDAQIVQLLLDAGSDISAKGRDGTTALHNAALHGQEECARVLLERGALAGVKDGQSCTPLHAAAMAGHTKVAEVLIQHGADLDALDEQCAPLHYAAARDEGELIVLLLKAGADANRKGNLMKTAEATPLHVAAKGDCAFAASLLMEGGAMVNATLAGPPFGSGETALHIAAWRGFNSVVRVLLRKGADVNATSTEGMKAIDFAEERGHLDIVQELEEWGAVRSQGSNREASQPRMSIVFGIPGAEGGSASDGFAGFAERLFGGGPKEESRFKRANSTTKFADVAGCDEAKEELEDVVAFLKDPSRFTRLGGRMNRGILLSGAPGTGKTLLAKAVAGEAGVPFIFTSGSEFDEVYAGLGAARVRELFAEARKGLPCIIFIDEIDAVGSARQARADRQDSRQTLNQLLAELDGFGTGEGVLLIAATNMPDVLDQALLRPGRIDRRVHVARPDLKGRKEIFKVHLRNVTAEPDVDIDVLARGTPGFTGADIANIINMAALAAAKSGKDAVSLQDFEEAKDRHLMGMARKSAQIPEKGKRTTAYHEGGHALVAFLLPGAREVHKVTIMPRGRALGMVMQLPEDDELSRSRREYLASIAVCMGGRAAEELIFGEEHITDGCSSDLEQATELATVMVERFGMSKATGVVSHSVDHWRGVIKSESMRSEVDAEVKRIVTDAYTIASGILKKHKRVLHELAEELMRVETMSGEELTDFLRVRRLIRVNNDDELPMLPFSTLHMHTRTALSLSMTPAGHVGAFAKHLASKVLQLREVGGRLWDSCVDLGCGLLLGKEAEQWGKSMRLWHGGKKVDEITERARLAESKAARAEELVSELAAQVQALREQVAAAGVGVHRQDTNAKSSPALVDAVVS